MVFRTLLPTIMTSLLAFTAAAMPISGTAIQCSDTTFQQSLSKIKTAVQFLKKPMAIKTGMPKEVYKAVRELSVANFGVPIVSVGEEKFSMGPTYFDNSIRVNTKYFDFLKSKVESPQVALSFVLSHELAHHVEGLNSMSVSKTHSTGGYEWAKLTDPIEREVYAHAHVDCLGLSLMKTAKMKFDLKAITDALITIRDECYDYRGQQFCDYAHAVRLGHVTKWFESIKDVK